MDSEPSEREKDREAILDAIKFHRENPRYWEEYRIARQKEARERWARMGEAGFQARDEDTKRALIWEEWYRNEMYKIWGGFVWDGPSSPGPPENWKEITKEDIEKARTEEEWKQLVEARKRVEDEEWDRWLHRQAIRDLQASARERGMLKGGDHCPKCGFAYAWDGTHCHHCHHHQGVILAGE